MAETTQPTTQTATTPQPPAQAAPKPTPQKPANSHARRASSIAANRAAAVKALEQAGAAAKTEQAATPAVDKVIENVTAADVVSSGPAPGESGKEAAAAEGEKPSVEQARQAAKKERASLEDRLRREREDYHRKQEERRAAEDLRKQQEDLKAKWAAIERAEKDPLGYLADKGMTADKLVEMGLKAGDPVAQMARELEALKKERAEERAAAQRAAAAAEQQRVQQAVVQVKQEFAKMVDVDPDTYPTLAGYPDEWIGERCYRIAEQYFNESGGKLPDKADVLNYLESVAKKEHDTRIARRTKKPASETTAPKEEPVQQVAQNARPKPSPKTITNGHTPRAGTHTAKKQTREERKRTAMALLGR